MALPRSARATNVPSDRGRPPISLSCEQELEDRLREMAMAEGRRPIAHVIRRLVRKGLAVEAVLGKEPLDYGENIETEVRALLEKLNSGQRHGTGH